MRLKGADTDIAIAHGRFYVRCSEADAERVETALHRLFGIAGWAKARIAEKEAPAVLAACVDTARTVYAQGIRTFKLEARRTDKRFPLDSYRICCEGGNAILQAFPDMRVDVHNPEATIQVEIRERAYIYSLEHKGLRGLPVGTAGRGLLLLSGGIDSPVAGNMMLSRGMALDGIYFHAYPYTSNEALEKVIRLSEILGGRSLGMRLFTANFTPILQRIKERAPQPWATILLRIAMMECSEKLAQKQGYSCLVTGESLSQVASQTIENITCTASAVTLPVLRPLIGIEKEDIIRMAESIGTYRISILPYNDCCTVFTPAHPVLHGNPLEALRLYAALELGDLLEEAQDSLRMDRCAFPV